MSGRAARASSVRQWRPGRSRWAAGLLLVAVAVAPGPVAAAPGQRAAVAAPTVAARAGGPAGLLSPAASPAFSAPARVAPAGVAERLTTGPDGSLWGAVSVFDRAAPQGTALTMALLHRSPAGSWGRRPLPWHGFPIALADDGATTFLLYAGPSCTPGPCDLRVVAVPHTGSLGVSRRLDTVRDGSFGGSLLAARGRWWAVWTRTVYAAQGPSAIALRQARSVPPALRPADVHVSGMQVGSAHLLLRGSTAWLAVGDDGVEPPVLTPSVALLKADAAGAWHRTAALFRGAAAAGFTTSSGRLLLAYLAVDPRTRAPSGRLVVAQETADLVFSRRSVPVAPDVAGTAVAASLGQVFVAYSQACRRNADGLAVPCGYVRRAGPTGGFSGPVEVTAPLAGQARPGASPGARVTALAAVRGRAVVLMAGDAEPGVWARAQR